MNEGAGDAPAAATIHGVETLFHDVIPVYPDVKLERDAVRGAALANALGLTARC